MSRRILHSVACAAALLLAAVAITLATHATKPTDLVSEALDGCVGLVAAGYFATRVVMGLHRRGGS